MSTNDNQTEVPRAADGRGPNPRRPGRATQQTPAPSSANHRNRAWCRTTEYKPPGSQKVGLGKDNQPSKFVYELDYGLTEKQFGDLCRRFPGIAFVQTGMDCHDHPIAHTSYRIVWENVMRKMNPGWRVADLSGNPSVNEAFNKRQARRERPIKIDTFCKVMSVKDSLRLKLRWGPPLADDGTVRWEEMTLYDMYRNDENQARFAKYDAFLMNHVLYYYKMEEITRLLALNKNAVLFATIHKLDGQNGVINCGEQRYSKDLQSGEVTQTNVETGEFYQHPDPAPWFRNFCYADEHGAIAWTVNKGCDDTYIVTITSTEQCLVPVGCWKDNRIVFQTDTERVVVSEQVVDIPPPAYAMEQVTIKTHDIVPGYKLSKEKVINITHPELFGTLKSFMINKPRNARTLTDLTAKAHREAGNNTLVGNNRRMKISPEALTEHIFAAWSCGVELEAHLFTSVTANNHTVASVNRNVQGKSLAFGSANALKQSVRLALGINSIMRSKEPVEAVLRHVDDLL